MSGPEDRPEELLHGLPVALGGVHVVATVVGYCEAMVGRIGLDGVDYPRLGQRRLQQLFLLVGEGLVLDRPGHIDAGLYPARLVVRAVRVVGLGEVATVEGGCRSDALPETPGDEQREPASHAVPGAATATGLLLGQRVEVP